MTVNVQKKINFINDCDCIVDFDELEKAILWYQKKPTRSLKKIYLHGRYPAISTHDEKIHVHRLLAKYWIKNKNLESDMHVHHKNGNRLDNRRNNLEIINGRQHLSNHNSGRTFTIQHRNKISKANKKRRGKKQKRMYEIPKANLEKMLNDGLSISAISRIYGCGWHAVKARIMEYGLYNLTNFKKSEIYENPELFKVE